MPVNRYYNQPYHINELISKVIYLNRCVSISSGLVPGTLGIIDSIEYDAINSKHIISIMFENLPLPVLFEQTLVIDHNLVILNNLPIAFYESDNVWLNQGRHPTTTNTSDNC
jgi:hypothetical protein